MLIENNLTIQEQGRSNGGGGELTKSDAPPPLKSTPKIGEYAVHLNPVTFASFFGGEEGGGGG